MRYFLFTDGASRGNPGPAAAGVVLKNGGGTIFEEKSQFLGRMTNNEAEYKALLLGLELAKRRVKSGDSLVCVMDSQLVVSQLKGDFKVKARHLRELITEVRSKEKEFPAVTYKLVSREKNAHADRLANRALNLAL
ncbi:reverse transcriptase-like protein [Candidatus Saccharibacteria bacterium]|nr:reverse transcriptase-like protein [Candidatus Saccharibacteria bacterium]